MPLPEFATWINPLLTALRQLGGTARPREAVDRFRRLAATQIGGEDVRLDVEPSLKLSCSRLEGVSIARDEDEIESVSGENLCQLEPNAARATGDQGGGSLNSISFWRHVQKLAKSHYTGITLREMR